MPDESSPEGARVESRDPFTLAVVQRYAAVDAAATRAAVARARAAQPGWGAVPVPARLRVLDRFRQRVFVRRHEIAALISEETGKAREEALVAEVVTSLDLARFYVRHAPGFLAPQRSSSATPALWRKRIVTMNEAIGVIGVISPWNYPFMLPVGVVAPALVAGNAVVLKPSELTPSTGALIAELCAAAGLPPGVLEVVQGARETGEALVTAGLDKLFFTGSVATGRKVAAACAEQLIPCVLELGGSDPAIVLDDADVEVAARGITWGRFANAGQTCVATKRVFVLQGIYDRFIAALERRVRTLRLRGDSDEHWDVGPLIRPAARTTMERMRDEATSRGARVLVTGAGASAETVFPPTVLVECPADAAVLREETFGPLLPVVRVRDEDEAIALANASEFGLSASVWSRSRRHARQVAARLQAGSVAINDVALVAGVAEVAHGGVKASGWGRAHGLAGLHEVVRTRTVVDDILPTVPEPWWFPYSPGLDGLLDDYTRLAHGNTLRQRLSGLGGALRLLFRR